MKIKNYCLLFVIVLILIFALQGCESNNVDVGKHAIIELPNGTIVEGEVESITRWSASFIEITIDGVTYYIHPINYAIIGE